MDIEKAKELVEELNWSHFDMSETASDVYVEAIDIVLSELEKKDKIIEEAKEYCEKIMNYEEYEKKHSKLSREIVRIKEGLTTHYKMWRVANNIKNILKGK